MALVVCRLAGRSRDRRGAPSALPAANAGTTGRASRVPRDARMAPDLRPPSDVGAGNQNSLHAETTAGSVVRSAWGGASQAPARNDQLGDGVARSEFRVC